MKAFLFSICVMGLLIAVILVNAAYVGRVSEEMQSALSHLPECSKATEEAQALLLRWQKEEKLLELSVSAIDMNDICNLLTELCVAARLNNEEAFEQARALCLLGLSRIHLLERFSFLHIL